MGECNEIEMVRKKLMCRRRIKQSNKIKGVRKKIKFKILWTSLNLKKNKFIDSMHFLSIIKQIYFEKNI